MKHPLSILAVILLACPVTALAQAQKPGVAGGTVVASEPGKAAVVTTVEVTAAVTAIDKATRTVTLKGPKRTVDVVAGEEVRNFDQIKIGDSVAAKYVEAITLELKKTNAPLGAKGEVAAARAKPGSAPAGVVGRQITVVTEVVEVNEKESYISLKGPKGNVVDLPVRNPAHFKVVKKGDRVEVVYTEALAIAVSHVKPAAKK